MKITEDLSFKTTLLARIRDREFTERTGVHASDLIYCLNKQALRRLAPCEDTEQETLTYSLGWASQRWLSGSLEDAFPLIVDGITVTPDTLVELGMEVGLNVPWELKCTFQSSERPIAESLHWLRQIMAQCYVTGVTEAYLTRLELMGNWRSIFGKKEEKALPQNTKPTLHAYHLEFTQDELDKNWEQLKARKVMFEAILATGKVLPRAVALMSGQEFECARCHYAGDLCPETYSL